MTRRTIVVATAFMSMLVGSPIRAADSNPQYGVASAIAGAADALLSNGASAPPTSGLVMGVSPDPRPQYFFSDNGNVGGPISLSELTARLAAGSIRLDTVLWKEGMVAWMQARYLPEVAVLYDRRTDKPAVTPVEPPPEVLPVEPEPTTNPPNEVVARTDVAPTPVNPPAEPQVTPAPVVADKPSPSTPDVTPTPAVAPTEPVTGPTGPVVANVGPTPGPTQSPETANGPTGPATPTGPVAVPDTPAVAPVAVAPVTNAPAVEPAKVEPAVQADPEFTEYMTGTWTFPNPNPPSLLTTKLLPTGEVAGVYEVTPPNQKEPVKFDVSGKWLVARIDAKHLSLTIEMTIKVGERTNTVKSVNALEIVDHDTLLDVGGVINKRVPG